MSAKVGEDVFIYRQDRSPSTGKRFKTHIYDLKQEPIQAGWLGTNNYTYNTYVSPITADGTGGTYYMPMSILPQKIEIDINFADKSIIEFLEETEENYVAAVHGGMNSLPGNKYHYSMVCQGIFLGGCYRTEIRTGRNGECPIGMRFKVDFMQSLDNSPYMKSKRKKDLAF
jgi:hypothetical protein